MKKKLCLIAAMTENHIIGSNGKLPWNKLRDDMKHFKTMTEGHIVILGRKNYESLDDGYRPLPKRDNIVLTHNPLWRPSDENEEDQITICHSIYDAMKVAEQMPGEKIWIIGGADIYLAFLERFLFDEIHLTIVHTKISGDVHFPPIWNTLNCYKLECSNSFIADDRNEYPITINKYIAR